MATAKRIYISSKTGYEESHISQPYYAPSDYDSNWRNLIFFPFEPNWQLFNVIFIILNTNIIIFDIVYYKGDSHYLADILHYANYVFYLMDTGLSFAHRYMLHYRVIREHEPRSLLSLAVDTVTLIPFYETYLLIKSLSRSYAGNYAFRNSSRIINLLRIYRIYGYINNKAFNADIGSHQAAILTIGRFIKIIICTNIFAAIWYLLGCWKCKHKTTWTVNLERYAFNPKSSLDWLLICYTNIGNSFSNNDQSNLRAENTLERVLLCALLLAGFVIHMMLYYARLTETFKKLYIRQFIFTTNLRSIKNTLQELNIEQKWRTKTIEFYNEFWIRRSGIKDIPKMFNTLPVPLQKEVTLDINWGALRHSHLFGDEDIYFKRALSVKMENEFYTSGEFVYRVDSLKSKMIYIASGVLQILSPEDEESPIISFSSGTILNEFNCLVPCVSTVNVICTTYCELQTLSIANLFRIIGSHPKQLATLRQKCKNRLKHAKEVRSFKISHRDTSVRDSSFKWIKHQWQNLALQKNKSNKNLGLKLDPNHTSRYLSLIVLSKAVELKVQAICLKSTWPFILEPNSSFRQFTEKIIILTIFLQSVMVPYAVAFLRYITLQNSSYFFALDCFYILDIYLKISTAIKTKHFIVNKVKSILRYKLKEINFLLDILAIIPIDYVFLLNDYQRLSTVCKLNRLLKTYQIVDYIKALEKSIWFDNLRARLLKYLYIYIIAGYWFACLLYTASCYNKICIENGWFANLMSFFDATYDDVGGSISFLISIMYSFSIYLNNGMYNIILVHLIPEMITHHFIVMAGYFVFTFYYSCLCATYILSFEKQKSYRRYYSSMVSTTNMNQLTLHLRHEFVRILKFWWWYYDGEYEELTGENGIFKDATKELKDKIIKERILECFEKVPLFQMCEPSILYKIAELSTLKTLPPNTEVVSKNSRSTWLYVILRGNCGLVSYMSGDIDHNKVIIQKPGSAFPVIEVLHQVLTLVSVTTKTAVELISIPYINLLKLLEDNDQAEFRFSDILKAHLQKNQNTLLHKQGRLPYLIPVEPSLGRGTYFKYEIFDTVKVEKNNQHDIDWKKIRKLSVIRFIFFKKTINPYSLFYVTWECIKGFLSLLNMFIELLYFNFLIEYQLVLKIILLILTIINIIDFYIRAHCQYYNSYGILVTHPLSTAKNYLKTSFVIDFYNTFAFRLLRADEILHNKNRSLFGVIISVVTSPCQIYRLIGLINWLQSDVRRTSNLLHSMKYIILTIITIMTCTTLVQTLTCPINWSTENKNQLNIELSHKSWISTTHLDGIISAPLIYIQCLHYVVTMYSSTMLSRAYVLIPEEALLFLALCTFLFMIRWNTLAIVTSTLVGGNVQLTIFQERIKNFLKFIKNEYIDESLVNHTIEHYEYFWKKTKGNDFLATVNKLHPNLRSEIVANMYGSTLKVSELFESADSGFIKQLALRLKIVHFKKDSEIIRTNDVQGLIFIIFQGKVDIYAAGTKLSTLGNGALFGCFDKRGKTRQTIRASAKFHVELLTIESNAFYNFCKDYPEIYQQLKRHNYLKNEFIDFKKGPVRTSKDMSRHKVSISGIRVEKTWCQKLFNKCSFLIKHTSKWYSIWDYIVCVHLATFNSLYLMHVILIDQSDLSCSILTHVLMFILDSIFFLKIYFEFNLTYVNNELGVIITNHRSICVRYVTSLKFYIDIIMIFPLRTILSIFIENESILKYAMVIKMFRFIFLIQYYNCFKDILTVKSHLRWTYLTYRTAISIQILTCLWWVTGCPGQHCIRVKASNEEYNIKFIKEEKGFPSLILAYQFVINIFTATGLTETIPTTVEQLISSLVIIIIFQFLIVALLSEFATFIAIQQYSLSKYSFNIKQLRTYLEGRELSKPIIEKVWKYSLQLFLRQRGEWMPEIVTQAPPYLKQNIMMSLYGHHLQFHPLFKNTHIDFVRQLVVWLQRCVFFPGNFLTEKGDVDGSMFFIHDGEVEIYDKNGNNEIFIGTLYKNSAFGEAQGFYNTEHNLSYKARTVVDALILKKSDWNYLLEWFPATNEQLVIKANEYRTKKHLHPFAVKQFTDKGLKIEQKTSSHIQHIRSVISTKSQN